jgi:O-succinylbenzoic acid--CoA ligase
MHRLSCPLFQASLVRPEASALLIADETVTYRQLDARAWGAAQRLAKAGVGPGDVVGLRAPSDAAAIAVFAGILRAEALACPVDPRFPDTYAAALFESVAAAHSVSPEGPLSPATLADWPPYPVPHELRVEPHQPAAVVFTSGSTGKPKGVVHSFGNHVHSARRANRNMPLAPGDAWLLSLGIHHVAGIGILFRCWEAGAAVAIPDEPLADAIYGTRITHISLVPAQLAKLMEETRHVQRLARMKGILLGGAPAPALLLRRAHKAGIPIHTSYGLTETAAQVTATPPGATLEQLMTSGKPLGPGVVRVSDAGEIEVGGPTLFLGYRDGQALARPLTEDGWFRTGDLGRLDGEGYLYVSGRLDNMFLAGGECVQPEEVEAALCALSGVAEAVVVPVPHAEFGATPAAFVRMTDGGSPDGETLRAALLEMLPKFKVPRIWFPWPRDLPHGMKVNRTMLKARAARQDME